MNIWQIARQLQFLLRQEKWSDGSTPVFADGSVVITDIEAIAQVLEERLIEPLALIVPGDGTVDPQHSGQQPDLLLHRLTVALVTVNQNLRAGEGAFVGANRVGVSDSRGRGLLEFEPKLFEVMKRLTLDDGVVIQAQSTGEGNTQRDPSDQVYAIKEYNFEVFCTPDTYYPPCRRLAATPRTGEVTLTWENPPARYDRYRVRLLRKTGSTPPANITDGTVLAAGESAESFVDSGLSANTYSYSVFMTYDDFYDDLNGSPAQDLQISAAASKSGLVVP